MPATSGCFRAALLTITLMSCGCTAWPGSEMVYAPPAAIDRPTRANSGTRDIIVVTNFANPAHENVPLRNVGPEIADALSRSLSGQTTLSVWFEPELGEALQSALVGPLKERRARLNKLQAENPGIRYLVEGKVTDFRHDRSKSRNVFGLGSSSHEAIIAMEFKLIDLETGRPTLTDHVLVRTDATEESVDSVYARRGIDSYLFWGTPLGQASGKAVKQASVTIDRAIAPSTGATDESLRVLSRSGDRKVRLARSSARDLRIGEEFYICKYDTRAAGLTPVKDRHTGHPIRARIDAVQGRSVTAWLIGRPSESTSLRGAVLLDHLPRDTTTKIVKGGSEDAAQ